MFIRCLIAYTMIIFLLSGCSKYNINSIDDIKADKDRNIVFMGYDFTIPDTRIKYIEIVCSHRNSENEIKNKPCLFITAKKGETKYTGTQVRKLEFGDYKVRYLKYTIKTGKQSTGTITIDLTEKVYIDTSLDIEFSVSRLTSPYVGRFYVDTDHENIGEYFKKKKKSIWSKNKLKVTGLSKYLKLKTSQNYSQDISLSKFRSALDAHINSPKDRRVVNDNYKNNINCTVDEGVILYESFCTINSITEISSGKLSKAYSFSFSSSRF